MATDINTILSYQAIDLTPFEARGAKPGTGNARTTGPVHVDGTYVPTGNILSGLGTFDTTDASAVTGFSFNPPWASLNALALNTHDTATIDGTAHPVLAIVNATSFVVDATGFLGAKAMTMTLGQREYLVEPDTSANRFFGDATFTAGSATILGAATTWLSQLAAGDIIKHDGFQESYVVDDVPSDTVLTITSTYGGDTTAGPYTA